MRVAPLWTVADCRPSNVDKKSVDGQQAVRLCNYTDVYNNHFLDADMDLMEGTAPPEQVERFQVRPGDVLMTKDSETNADIGIPSLVRTVEPGMVCGYHLTLLRPDPKALEPSYLFWWLESKEAKDFWYTNSFGVTRFSLVSPTVWRLPVRLPDLVEQRRITAFLDRETAEIDAMGAELDRLVAALRERSSSGAASLFGGPRYGLGVERGRVVGRFPSSWRTTRFDVAFPATDERNGSSPLGPMLSVSEYRGIEPKQYGEKESPRPDHEVAHYRVVRPGQIVANIMWLNHSGIGVAEHLGYTSPDYRVYNVGDGILPRYAHHLLRSPDYRAAFTLIGEGVRPNAQRVNTVLLGMLPVPVPPQDEQARIVAEIDGQTARITDMIADANRLKTLLAERRSTLITRVLTGAKEVPA